MPKRRVRLDRSPRAETASRAVRLRAEQLELRDVPAITGLYPAVLNGVPQAPLGVTPQAVATFLEHNLAAPATDFTGTIAAAPAGSPAGAGRLSRQLESDAGDAP